MKNDGSLKGKGVSEEPYSRFPCSEVEKSAKINTFGVKINQKHPNKLEKHILASIRGREVVVYRLTKNE